MRPPGARPAAALSYRAREVRGIALGRASERRWLPAIDPRLAPVIPFAPPAAAPGIADHGQARRAS